VGMTAEHHAHLVRASLERYLAASYLYRGVLARLIGLLDSDVAALQQITRAGQLTPSELARRMPQSAAGTTSIVDRLRRAGLISRDRDRSDGRRAILRATAQGEQRLVSALAPLTADLAALGDGLSVDERACVERFMMRLAELAERHAERLLTEAQDAARAAADLPAPVLWG
jgi:DNA-binding MarR family transcriptional regulator